jgi:hypothetical protein
MSGLKKEGSMDDFKDIFSIHISVLHWHATRDDRELLILMNTTFTSPKV